MILPRFAAGVLRLAWPVILVLSGSSCAHGSRATPLAPMVSAGPATSPVRLPSLWAFPGSDVPAFCLVLYPAGRAEFQGGFVFFNPVRWSWSAERGLALTIPALNHNDAALLQQELEAGRLIGYDPNSRTMTTALAANATELALFGYTLAPLQQLRPFELSSVRRRCPALRRQAATS